MAEIDVDIEQTTQSISADIETQLGVMWGDISGNIESQTDLMTLLNSNYLKTSGGEMTGAIKWSGKGAINGTLNGLQFYRISTDGNLVRLADLTVSFFMPGGDMSLGYSNQTWKALYTRAVYSPKINNGSDIDIPSTSGTMVVATPPEDEYDYVLKSVIEDGIRVVKWVRES